MGWYRRTLCAPAAGKRSFLEFDAASIVAAVWLNGVKLGRHEGAFSRFRLDATAAMRPGCDNVLAVRNDNGKPDPGGATSSDERSGGTEGGGTCSTRRQRHHAQN